MKNLLIFLTNKFLTWLITPSRVKEIIIPLSREGFLEIVRLLPTFKQEGMVVPGKLLYINFKRGEYVGKLTFQILENRDGRNV